MSKRPSADTNDGVTWPAMWSDSGVMVSTRTESYFGTRGFDWLLLCGIAVSRLAL